MLFAEGTGIDPAQFVGWLVGAVIGLASFIGTALYWYAKRIEANDLAHDVAMKEERTAHATLLAVQRVAFDSSLKEQRQECKEERERLTNEFKQTLQLVQQHAVEINAKLKEEISSLKLSVDLLAHAIDNLRLSPKAGRPNESN